MGGRQSLCTHIKEIILMYYHQCKMSSLFLSCCVDVDGRNNATSSPLDTLEITLVSVHVGLKSCMKPVSKCRKRKSSRAH